MSDEHSDTENANKYSLGCERTSFISECETKIADNDTIDNVISDNVDNSPNLSVIHTLNENTDNHTTEFDNDAIRVSDGVEELSLDNSEVYSDCSSKSDRSVKKKRV